jgi:hypothetical protein
VLRGGRSRRRFVALIAYYVVLVVVLGPMCLSVASADAPRVPVRISLNLAMRTPTTDIATFTTPFPLTVGVAGDGTFTIPRSRLSFGLVDVPVGTSHPALGRLTVRASAFSSFGGKVDLKTGAVTLTGFMSLLWSKAKPSPHAAPSMLDCPVGPFAVHLSSTTLGGADLTQQSLLDPTSRTARLVDDNLDVRAVPDGTKECAGLERDLNGALSLPIEPKPVPTSATVSTTSTTMPVPVTTATTESTTTTTVESTTTVEPTTTIEPPTTEAPTTVAPETTTTAAPTVDLPISDAPISDAPAGVDPSARTGFADTGLGTVQTDGLGVVLDPDVLALEPIPSIVSTLTIAAVPSGDSSTTTPTTRPFVSPSRPSPPSPNHANVVPRERGKKANVATHKRRVNKHAQTTTISKSTTDSTVAARRQSAPPLYFSPFNFGPLKRIAPHNPLSSSGPLVSLGANAISKHRTALSILFLGLLVLPLVVFGVGLVASDFGYGPRALAGRRRRSRSAARIRIR